MAEEVKVIIGADTKQLESELIKAQNNLRKFEAALRKATNVKEIDYLSRNISLLKEKINTLNTSQGNLSASSNKAGMALNDLSRIAQDAPYGFIGISNNINPLVESFGRLRAETGSTGGALKALVSGLKGPAGIGLAFGVVSAAISFASVGLSRWIKQQEEAKEKTDENKKAQEQFAKGLDSARASALSSSFQLQAYIDVAKNTVLPLQQRNYALQQANDILGEHGKKLDLANVATEKITEQTKLFTQATIAQSIATKFADKLADLTIKQAKTTKLLKIAQDAIEATTLDLADANKKYSNSLTQLNYVSSDNTRTISTDIKLMGSQANAIKSSTKLTKELATVNAEITTTQTELNDAITTSTKLFGVIGTESKKTKNQLKSTGETIDEIIAKFRLKISADEAKFLPPLEEVRAKISDYDAVIEKLIVDKKVKLTFPKLIELQKELQGLRDLEANLEKEPIKIKIEPIGPQLDKEFLKLNEAFLNFRQGLKSEELKFLPDKEVTKNQINDYRAFIEKLIKEFNISENNDVIKKLQTELSTLLGKSTSNIIDVTKTIQDQLQTGAYEAGVGFAEALGRGMSSGDISSFFDGINMMLADGMIRIGKQFIKFATELLVIQKTLLTNPTSALIAGIALVAFGTALKSTLSSMSSTNAFATGTSFAPGGMALVGERGPELVSLPQGSKVIPNGKTNSMMQGAMQAVEVYGTLRGQDIYFSNKKYGLTYNRQT